MKSEKWKMKNEKCKVAGDDGTEHLDATSCRVVVLPYTEGVRLSTAGCIAGPDTP
jgi:hypothetical protein